MFVIGRDAEFSGALAPSFRNICAVRSESEARAILEGFAEAAIRLLAGGSRKGFVKVVWGPEGVEWADPDSPTVCVVFDLEGETYSYAYQRVPRLRTRTKEEIRKLFDRFSVREPDSEGSDE